MITSEIDPRDVRWERLDPPRFRARLWRRESDHPDSIWRASEHRFAPDATLTDALAWMGDQSGDVTLFVEVDFADHGLGLICILGREPSEAIGGSTS